MIILPNNLAATLNDSQVPHQLAHQIATYVAVFVVAFLLVAICRILITRLRHHKFKPRQLIYDGLIGACIILLAYLGGSYVYQQNMLGVKTAILKPVQQHERQVAAKKASSSTISRATIRKMVMRNAAKGFEKQGFVSIPSRNILLPIYNDAYSDEGLNLGADYANRSSQDPDGTKIPVMGQGNYGLAAHNFNDGVTGFSGLQQVINQNAPYISNGQLKGSSWLNGTSVLLANNKGLYQYEITGQDTVKNTDVSVLDPTKNAQLTIISCLFPSTQYRIITHADLKHTYTWKNAPQSVFSRFNLQVYNTNARVSWWNPGVEEGANGDQGGTK